jgi:TatD DNase family protein
MPLRLIDTHTHLDDRRFAGDLEQVLARAEAAGCVQLLTIGVDRETSENAVALAQKYPLLRAVVGIQPNYVAEMQAGDWERIVELAKEPCVVGLGETGLDKYWDRAPFALQQEYFEKHLALSRETGLPVIIHCREAEADVVAQLRQHTPVHGLMHSFCGSYDNAQDCLALGLHISFSGMVTFTKNDALRTTAKSIPTDKLLIETDCPYLSPQPVRGKRNEPAFVKHVAETLAEAHNTTLEQMGEWTTANAVRLFGLHQKLHDRASYEKD